MGIIFRLVFAILAGVIGSSCHGAFADPFVSPTTFQCQPFASPQSVVFGPGGGQTRLQVRAFDGCVWRAASDAVWVLVSPSSGQGDGELTVAVSSNPESSMRTATIALNGARFAVSQEAGAPAPPSAVGPPAPAPTPAPLPTRPRPAPH